jgi:hypothetical protein
MCILDLTVVAQYEDWWEEPSIILSIIDGRVFSSPMADRSYFGLHLLSHINVTTHGRSMELWKSSKAGGRMLDIHIVWTRCKLKAQAVILKVNQVAWKTIGSNAQLFLTFARLANRRKWVGERGFNSVLMNMRWYKSSLKELLDLDRASTER